MSILITFNNLAITYYNSTNCDFASCFKDAETMYFVPVSSHTRVDSGQDATYLAFWVLILKAHIQHIKVMCWQFLCLMNELNWCQIMLHLNCDYDDSLGETVLRFRCCQMVWCFPQMHEFACTSLPCPFPFCITKLLGAWCHHPLFILMSSNLYFAM